MQGRDGIAYKLFYHTSFIPSDSETSSSAEFATALFGSIAQGINFWIRGGKIEAAHERRCRMKATTNPFKQIVRLVKFTVCSDHLGVARSINSILLKEHPSRTSLSSGWKMAMTESTMPAHGVGME